uniref:Secreted protein n=1 Tax=Strongyloides venezuelensis TaxID=75913 RepID=A0A0K0EUV9_STRVS
MKSSSRIALLAIFVAVIMACLITYGNANSTVSEPSSNGSTTPFPSVQPSDDGSVAAPVSVDKTDTSQDSSSSAATGLSYSGSNSIILSTLGAISIILGAKL